MNKRNTALRGVAALAIIAALGALFWFLEIKDSENSLPPAGEGAVTVQPLEKKDVSGISEPEPAATAGKEQGAAPALAEDASQAALESTLGVIPNTAGPNPQEEDEDKENVVKGTLNKGDTVAKLLGERATPQAVHSVVEATRRVFPLTSFRAGQSYAVTFDLENGGVKRFEYEIDTRRRLVVEGDEQPVARVEEIVYDVRLALIEGRIDDNLFQAVADMGESPQLALLLAKLFGWEINFIRDLQEGDSFSILVEKLYREGEYKGYGRTLGANFTNKGKTYEAFLFNDAKGAEQYYNIKGENLKKTLLQAPLSFTRLTSRFTQSRKHPILGGNRPHLGVDYGAPTGTPVKAVGDGVVTLRGWVGGYGNQVVLRHAAGLESMYSHLSGFARGLKQGSRVRQGQVIAFVGSTGLSTGPHLDFRLKQNSKFVDPTKAINPRSEPVRKSMQRGFNERMALVRTYMQGQRPLSEYTPLAAAAVSVKDTAEEEAPARGKRRHKR